MKIILALLLFSVLPARAACVNEGTDRRVLHGIVCALQGVASFRSFNKPIGIHVLGDTFFIGVPPIVAGNIPHGFHRFLHLRAGWRWDAHPNTKPEKGCWYILSGAAKDIDHLNRFWLDECVQPQTTIGDIHALPIPNFSDCQFDLYGGTSSCAVTAPDTRPELFVRTDR